MLIISSTIKEKSPVKRSFFINAKDKILGKKYILELVFIGPEKSLALNSKYRKIKKPTDILSFELEKDAGEIYINPNIAKQKAKLFGRTYENYIKYLFIHGLCHLKGMKHGSRMEYEERRFCKLLKV